MSTTASQFQSKTEEKSFDASHRQKIKFNIGKYDIAVAKGLPQFANLEAARKKAHLIKWKTIENLDRYLLEFESNFIRKGGKVIWANTVEEAQKEILAILKKHETKMDTLFKMGHLLSCNNFKKLLFISNAVVNYLFAKQPNNIVSIGIQQQCQQQ